MNTVVKHLLLNIDTALLCLPTLAIASIGVGFNMLEESRYKAWNPIGWLGCRACTILAVHAGILFIVSNFVKTLFAKLANGLMGQQFKLLQSYSSYTENALTTSIAASSSLYVVIPYVSFLIKEGKEVEAIIASVINIANKLHLVGIKSIKEKEILLSKFLAYV